MAVTEGTVYWITGLSGAGKSTLGQALHTRLLALGRHAVLCDGDEMRELLLETPAHGVDDRLRAARFYGRLCRFLSRQGNDVVVATLSLFHEVQAWNRTHLARYVEIVLDLPLEFLEQRDPRGLYRRARAGEVRDVVGVDIAPQWPVAPDLVFRDPAVTPDAMVDQVLRRQAADRRLLEPIL